MERARLLFLEEYNQRVWNRRQRACLETIYRRSFKRGKTRAWIPKLNYFIEDNDFGDKRLDKAEISRGIDELEAMHIISAPEKVKASEASKAKRLPGWYGINVVFGFWDAPKKKSSAVCEQLWLDLEEPDLDQALRETFVEFGGEAPSTMPQGSGAVPALRLGPPAPGCVRDADQAPVGDKAAGPPVGSTANRPRESQSPEGTRPATPAHGAGCCENPNDATLGAVQGEKTAAARSAADGDGIGKSKKPLGIPTPGRGACVVSPHTPLPEGTETDNRQLDNRAKRQTLTATERARARGGVGIFPTLPKRRVSVSEEAHLMETLEAFFSVPSPERWEHEMRRSEDFWRLYVVRNCPDELDELLGEGKFMDHRGYPFQWKPAWLSRKVGEKVGVSDWKWVEQGPPPVP